MGTATLTNGGRQWVLRVEPHVAIRLKNVFPRTSKTDIGKIYLTATDEVCRDLEWFMGRYPLEVLAGEGEEVADARGELARRARAHDARREASHQVMQGEYSVPIALKLALPPRPYQELAAALAYTNGSLLLADELGLGKTVTAIALLALAGTLPAVVVCPVHIARQWKREIERFLPGAWAWIAPKSSPTPFSKTTDRRPDVIILSYHKLSGWSDWLCGQTKTKTVIFDEVQELRRTGTHKYTYAKAVAAAADYRLGLSATPIYNYGGEFWAVIDALAPGALGGIYEFEREWCSSGFGGDKARIKDPRAFGTYLRESALMLRRTRAEVSRELPSLSRVIQEVDSDPKELEKIQGSATELARIILRQKPVDSDTDIRTVSAHFANEMRQAIGLAKAPYVAAFVRMLAEETGEQVVLFGWHRAVYDIWKEHLAPLSPAWFTGSESTAAKDRELKRFLDGHARVLVMSLRSGAGVDGLQGACSRVVIGELDWSPGAIEQCIGRVHRDGQTEPVIAYYVTARDGADPVMLDVLGMKKGQIDGVRAPDGDLTVMRQVDPDHVRRLAEAFLGAEK